MGINPEEIVKYEKVFNDYLERILNKCEINDVLSNDDIDKCLDESRGKEDELALRILTNVFNRISGDFEFNKLKYKVIMEGFLLKFNINKITNKQIEQYQDSNKIRILGYKKCDIEKYWLELSFRRRVMETVIKGQYDEGLQTEKYKSEYDD